MIIVVAVNCVQTSQSMGSIRSRWVSSVYEIYSEIFYRCSAVAEMGDRLATIDMGRKLAGGCAPYGGKLDPHVAQCGLGRGLPSH